MRPLVIPAADQPLRRPAAGYTLALLTLLSALAFMDRQVLAVLITPVKAEFGLSDVQVGLVTGLGYALAFAVLGVPMGRLADRLERRSVVAWCRGLGGALAALGAMTTGAGSLMLTRAGGALSDAGAAPASMALLADLYPPQQRSRVMSVFSAGASLGALLALVVGAWLAQRHGWRVTVAVVGAASLSVALLLRTTVRPWPLAAPLPAAGPASRGAVAEVWRLPAARSLILATGFALVAGYAFGAWNLSLLVRRHGLDLQAAGMVSTVAALASVVGSLWGGALADRLSRRDLRWQLGVPMLGIALALPCGVGYLLLPPGALGPAVALVAGFSLFISWWAAPVYAALSLVVPQRRRATANAMMLMAGAVVGTGVGPVGVGWLSDHLAHLGVDASPGGSLRWALLGAMAMLLPCLLQLLHGLRAYPAARLALLAATPAPQPAVAAAAAQGAR